MQHLLEFYTVGWLRKSGFEAHGECDFERPVIWGSYKGSGEL